MPYKLFKPKFLPNNKHTYFGDVVLWLFLFVIAKDSYRHACVLRAILYISHIQIRRKRALLLWRIFKIFDKAVYFHILRLDSRCSQQAVVCAVQCTIGAV